LRREHLDRAELIAERAVALLGMDLVAVEFSRSARPPVLRIYIDKDGGVTLDDCVRASRAIGDALDTEDPIPFRYRLEVSSPGVDRPLRNRREFERCIGQAARIVLRKPAGRGSVLRGNIERCTDDAVFLCDKDGEEVEVSFENIVRARLDVDPWEMARMKGKKGNAC